MLCFLILGCGLLQPLTAEARNGLKRDGKSAEFVTDPTEKISGKVVDENGEAMIGVSILVKGTTRGTVTDNMGNFSLDVSIGDVLVLSFIGYETQNVTIENGSPLNISMQLDADSVLNEVVVVGYGTQTKRSMTGAVSNLKADKLQEIPSSNLSSLLAGRMSGVYVQAPTGTPGIASNISIRARGSMNDNPPVYVIDGVIRDKRAFDALDPTEVQEVSLLKDAASAALYGSRSAGGVVLVATKTGSNSKAKINYTTNYSIEKQTNLPKMMRGVDIAKMANTWVPQNSSWYHDQDFIDWISTVNGGYGYDYIKDVYIDPASKRHALNVTGGNENIQYFAGGTYFDQQGWLDPLKFNKFNLRASVTAKLNKNLTAHVNLSQYSTERQKFWWPYDWGSDALGDLWKKLQTWQYFYPNYIDGKPWNQGWLGNVGELITNSGYWRNRENVQNSLVSLKYDLPFVPGMSVKATYNYERYNNNLKNYQKKHTLWNIEGAVGDNFENAKIADPESTVLSNGPSREYISSQAGSKSSYQFNLQLDYKRSFGNHNVDAFVAYEQAEDYTTSIDGVRYDFPIIVKDQYFATSGDAEDSRFNGSETEWGRLSYIGRATYDYAYKYIVSASFRYDGSLNFGPDYRWGLFPAISAAWVISEESFFKPKAINYLKFRASMGTLGNDALGRWRWLETYNAASGFYFGENPKSTKGIEYGGLVNPMVTWEKSRTYNLGLDAVVFNNFNVSAEYWFKNTFDILGTRNQSIPTTFGANMPPENYGEVHSNGVELELGYNGSIGKAFKYFVNGNFTYATNEVVKWDQAENVRPFEDRIGKTYDYISGLRSDGLLRTQADLDALPEGYTIYGAVPQLGWINYKDISGPSGEPDNKIDDWDKVVLYNHSSAPVTYGLNLGFSWKGIDVEALFQGMAGFYKYPDVQAPYPWTRIYAFWEDSWTPETALTATKPIPNHDIWQNRAGSDFYYQKGDFTRLKYVNVGYNLPTKIVDKIGLSNARIFVSGTNLLTFSKFKVYDPELGSAGTFPINKSFTGGMSLTF